MKTTTTTTVVIADDHYIFRSGLKTILSQTCGDRITVIAEVSTGTDALGVVHELAPDIVLMDIQMPVMNGIDATTQICQEYPLTRVIGMSGHVEREPVLRMIHAGAHGYLLKSSEPHQIEAAILKVAQGGSYFVQEVAEHLVHRIGQLKTENTVKKLTEKECKIVQLICSGYTSKEIGNMLNHSKRTIDGYRENIMSKVQASNTIHLFKFALQAGLHSI